MTTCKLCSSSFTITDQDRAFYEKVSPVLNGEKYLIPEPTLCPDCRQQRRLTFRNERKLFSDECDLCKKRTVSLYSPEKPFKVYCQPCWWGDGWEALQHGRKFDFSKSFLEQFQELRLLIPRISIFNLNSVNSEYNNHSVNNKNCYMGVAVGACEDVLYSHWTLLSKSCCDTLYCESCELCYECSYCQKCYATSFSQHCQNVRDSLLCFECRDCEYSIGCVQLQHQKYHILNQPVSEEEFKKVKHELLTSQKKFQEMKEKFETLKRNAPHKASNQINCVESTGDDLYNCKNADTCFNCRNLEDSKYMYDLGNNKDSMDCYEHGWLVQSELNYEAHAGMAGYHFLFTNLCAESRDLLYSEFCFSNSSFLFGCVGLKKQKYCILNKQYTKEEYEVLVPKIIEHMKTNGEWGEFFPSTISPFGYNESTAQEYFPLTKAEALEKGFRWTDYEAPSPKAEKLISANKLPEDIKDIPDDILNWAIECEVTKRPFKIIRQELDLYRKLDLPIPRQHPDERHKERMMLRNPRKLWQRECSKCTKEIQTTYAPDRPERVYCEQCYLKEVY